MTTLFRSRRGFTLVEMLVVISIIALLASLTVVMLSRVRKSADKTRIGFQLQSLSVGVDAYLADFNALPVTTLEVSTTTADDEINRDGVRGARLLCKMLMGASGQGVVTGTSPNFVFNLDRASQDGAAGLGFRVPGRSGVFQFDSGQTPVELLGKKYGPYLQPDKFELSRTDDKGALLATPFSTAEKFDDTTVLLDANRKVILFYPVRNAQAPVRMQYAHVAVGHSGYDVSTPPEVIPPPPDVPAFQGTSMYLSNDNSCWLLPSQFRRLVGDQSGDMRILTPEVAQGLGKYILWSAGPDGFYGPDLKNGTLTFDVAIKQNLFDDVTNFQGN